MKALIKLEINSDKLINNAELVSLRGGYDQHCDFYMADYNWGSGYFSSQNSCETFLHTYFNSLNYCSCS